MRVNGTEMYLRRFKICIPVIIPVRAMGELDYFRIARCFAQKFVYTVAALNRPGDDVLKRPSALVYEYMVQTSEAEDLLRSSAK
jgi:hypothetical protein